MRRGAIALPLLLTAACGGSGGNDAGVAALSITTAQMLPDVGLGQSFSLQLAVEGGNPPYAFTVGGLFPVGFTLDPSSGLISGRPTKPGHTRFIITVTDHSAQTATKLFAIFIVPEPLRVLTRSLPAARKNAPYQAQLMAGGGVPPLGWTLTASSMQPALRLGQDGALSGTPTSSGSFNLGVRVTDAEASTATAALQLNITD